MNVLFMFLHAKHADRLIDSREESTKGLTIVNRMDMSYLGVCDVWFNEIGMVLLACFFIFF